jgi:hypothetical protein
LLAVLSRVSLDRYETGHLLRNFEQLRHVSAVFLFNPRPKPILKTVTTITFLPSFLPLGTGVTPAEEV